jgi:hypothetical protein
MEEGDWMRKNFVIVIVLITSIFITDLLIWNFYLWRDGLGSNPEEEIYESEYDSGFGYLKVSLGAVRGITFIDEFLTNTFNMHICTCKFELYSSRDVVAIAIINIGVSMYINGAYERGFFIDSGGTVFILRRSIPLNVNDTITIKGNIIANFSAEGEIISKTFPVEIIYKFPGLSWFESQGFYIIILVQVVVAIILISIIYFIKASKPTEKEQIPYPIILKKKTDFLP